MRRPPFLAALLTPVLLCAGCPAETTSYDFDNDGYADDVDCAPEDASINPGAAEDCLDQIDNDCDGRPDAWDTECNELVSTDDGWSAISSSIAHSCGIDADAAGVCWGCQQGIDSFGQCEAPTGTCTQIEAAPYNSCALTTSGEVTCWGCQGEDSAGNTADHGQCDPPGSAFTQIAAGHFHACGIASDGSVECWGCDGLFNGGPIDAGQCDPPQESFAQLDAGFAHSCGVFDDGTLVCWGANSWGQSSPPPGSYLAVSTSYFHTCGLTTDGDAECWGCGEALYDFGQCVSHAGPFIAVTTSFYQSCGLAEDGELICWGCEENGEWTSQIDHGQCGSDDVRFDQVDLAEDHNCGIYDGIVMCWGANNAGQSSPP